VPLSGFGDPEARLERDGIKIVEYRRWKGELVRLTLETDVTPISRDDVLRAVRLRRVLSISDWSSMGDGYVDRRRHPRQARRRRRLPLLLPVRPGTPGLPGRELPASGPLNPWDSGDDFFDFYKESFTREYFRGSFPESVVDHPPAPLS